MKLIDVPVLCPPDTSPEDWQAVLREIYGPDHVYITTQAERLSWLKRLAEEEVWGDVTVLTDRSAFPFWTLVPEKVVVQDEAGKKLTKTQRVKQRQDISQHQQWAIAASRGLIGIVPISKVWRERKGIDDAAQELLLDYLNSKPEGRTLYETDGIYELATPGRFSEIREKILAEINSGGWWCWDSETDQTSENDIDDPNPWDARLVDISISVRPGHAWRFPVAHDGAANFGSDFILYFLTELYDATAKAGGRVVLHNCKYDYSVLANPIQGMGIDVIYQHWLPITEDTMLMASVANEPRAGLKALARDRLGLNTIDYKRLTGGLPFSQVPEEPANIYAGQDADWPLRLHSLLLERLRELEVEHVYQREMAIIEYFMRIERRGMLVDRTALEALHQEGLEKRERALRGFITCLINHGIHVPDGFNIGSSQQLGRVMFSSKPDGLGLPVVERTPTGQAATGKKVWNKMQAEGISHPAIAWYREWSKWEQLVTAFTTPLQRWVKDDGRLHSTFNQLGAATGRTSASNPNPQQQPKLVRKCIVAEPGGEIAGIDYSQIELRVLAAEFDEPKMLETYNLPRYLPDGSENPEADIHFRTQTELTLDDRRDAKGFNFGTAFGAGEETLSVTTGKPKPIVRALLKRFYEAYPHYTRNLRARQKQALEEGLVRNWFGRVRLLAAPQNDKELAEVNRLVSNTPVQGGALDIIKWAMMELIPLLREFEPYDIHPINMVHDELDFECTADTPKAVWKDFLVKVEAVMTRCNPFIDKLPLYLDVELGTNWADLRAPEPVEAAA